MGSVVESVGGMVGDVFGGLTGAPEAAAATTQAAGITAQAQREALEYMKEREALPQQFREAGLSQLAGIYGLPGGTGSQQQLIEQAMASPLYQQQIAGIEAGVPAAEEALLRTQAATGGLRSGASVGGIAGLAQEREALKNQALTQAYGQQLSGISGMAQLPSNVPNIAQAMVAPAATQAQGITGAAQAEMMGRQTGLQALAGIGGALMSDIRLKDNIKHIGEKNGHQWFEWDWCPEAKEFGLEGQSEGVMAHLVYETNPEAIGVINNLLCVDYEQLGLGEAV